jgi:hypothetical protein
MELLLNLTWLLLAIICSVALLRRAQKDPNSAQLWIFITAVVCIMVLLFPVISMTDDLHAEVFTAEESGKRRVAVVHVQQLLAFVHVLAAWLLISVAPPQRATWVSSTETCILSPREGMRVSWSSRPPPALSLA